MGRFTVKRSQALYEKARTHCPTGTQTRAKKPIASHAGEMPLFIESAKGCRIRDVDGNEYIDYRCSLGPIVLGHRYPAVEKAVRAQMRKGVLFSMASPIEVEAARRFCRMVPGAERVRFLKTGGEVNSACVRLARAFTGREKILSCGYHGWQDWWAAKTQAPDNTGVPKCLKALTLDLPYGDLAKAEELIETHRSDLAAVITEPYQWKGVPKPDWVRGLRELTKKRGVLLIYDEILTGFRLAPGGAAEYFGVAPDLAGYAKAMANGYPLAAFAGRADIMNQLEESRVFITTTYGGETLSLAAAVACMEIHAAEPVHRHLDRMGTLLGNGWRNICSEAGLTAVVDGSGVSPILGIEGRPELMDRVSRGMYSRGVFPNPRYFMSYSHGRRDIQATLEALKGALDAALGGKYFLKENAR
ncbi:MAG: aminotransferase class III-fold pyridoxal phosphate-dependent enzyme [Planctomycetota bacterium]